MGFAEGSVPAALTVSGLAGVIALVAVMVWSVMRVRGSEPKPMLITSVVAAASGLTGVLALSVSTAVYGGAAVFVGLVGAMMAMSMPPMRHEVAVAADGSLYHYTDEDRSIINEAHLRRWRIGVSLAGLMLAITFGLLALSVQGFALVVAAASISGAFAVGHSLTVLACESGLKLAESHAIRASASPA